MPKGTPTSATQKWLRNLKASGPSATDGANSVDVAPGQQAAAQQEKMLTNLTEAVNSGKWARNVAAVSLTEWKEAYIKKGIPAMQRGADMGQSKMQDYLQFAFPVIEQLQNEIANMPDGSLEDSIARSAEWIRGASSRLKRD